MKPTEPYYGLTPRTAPKATDGLVLTDQDAQLQLTEKWGSVGDVLGELRLWVGTPEMAGEVLKGKRDGQMYVFDNPLSFWDSPNVGTATRHSWVDPWICCGGTTSGSQFHKDPQ